MKSLLHTPQPLIGFLLSVTTVGALMVSWSMSPGLGMFQDPWTMLGAGCLGAMVAASGLFPVHLPRHAKLYFGSAGFYLLAVFLPPALAAATSGAGILIGGLVTARQTGSTPADIATDVSRFVLVVLLGSWVTHTAIVASLVPLHLIVPAVILWAGDVLSCPLLLGPISGDGPGTIVRRVVREAGMAEVIQYLLGLAGAVAVARPIWGLAVLVLPVVLLAAMVRPPLMRQARAIYGAAALISASSRRSVASCLSR